MHEIMLRKCSFSLRSIFKLLSLVLVLAISALSASAQSTQGTIVGTVKDANGSLVPGANVTLTNTDEGTVRNDSGQWKRRIPVF